MRPDLFEDKEEITEMERSRALGHPFKFKVNDCALLVALTPADRFVFIKVIVCTHFERADYAEFLSSALPMEHMEAFAVQK